VGRDRNKGEYLIQGPSGKNTFVEVKSPGWEGELSDEERKGGRLRQEKYLAFEGRAVAPWKAIQFAVDKAYKKFATDIPNLLIVADDLFLPLRYDTAIHAEEALYETRNNGCFIDARYANLGGVGVFWIENDGRQIWYEIRLFLNPHALRSTMLPDDIRLGFHGQENPSADRNSTRAAGYPAETPFQRWLREGV